MHHRSFRRPEENPPAVPNACAAHQPPLPSRGALGLHSGRRDGSQGRQPVGVTFAFPVSPAGIWFLLSLSLHITVISGLMPLKSPFYCLPRCNEERSRPPSVRGCTAFGHAQPLCRGGPCSVRLGAVRGGGGGGSAQPDAAA